MTVLEAFKIVYNNFDYLISDVCIENDDVNICLKTIKEQLPTIKQALIKVEKEHKALEIIKEKNVDIDYFLFWSKQGNLEKVEDYNHLLKHKNGRYQRLLLTKEEFNLLKEVLE